MKTKLVIKLVFFGSLITAVGYWLKGHDILTGAALLLLFVLVLAKVISAIVLHRRGAPPSKSGGSGPAGKPAPHPSRGGPPALSAAAAPKQ